MPTRARDRSVGAAQRPEPLLFAVPDRAEPWQRRHVLGSLLLAAIGAVGMAVCWYVGAGKLSYDDQVPWLVGSIASSGVVVLGGVYWLICAFRQVSLMQRDLATYLRPWLAEARPEAPSSAQVEDLVWAPGMHRTHRPQCLLARGKKNLEPVTAAEMVARGLTGCGACGT